MSDRFRTICFKCMNMYNEQGETDRPYKPFKHHLSSSTNWISGPKPPSNFSLLWLLHYILYLRNMSFIHESLLRRASAASLSWSTCIQQVVWTKLQTETSGKNVCVWQRLGVQVQLMQSRECINEETEQSWLILYCLVWDQGWNFLLFVHKMNQHDCWIFTEYCWCYTIFHCIQSKYMSLK